MPRGPGGGAAGVQRGGAPAAGAGYLWPARRLRRSTWPLASNKFVKPGRSGTTVQHMQALGDRQVRNRTKCASALERSNKPDGMPRDTSPPCRCGVFTVSRPSPHVARKCTQTRCDRVPSAKSVQGLLAALEQMSWVPLSSGQALMLHTGVPGPSSGGLRRQASGRAAGGPKSGEECRLQRRVLRRHPPRRHLRCFPLCCLPNLSCRQRCHDEHSRRLHAARVPSTGLRVQGELAPGAKRCGLATPLSCVQLLRPPAGPAGPSANKSCIMACDWSGGTVFRTLCGDGHALLLCQNCRVSASNFVMRWYCLTAVRVAARKDKLCRLFRYAGTQAPPFFRDNVAYLHAETTPQFSHSSISDGWHAASQCQPPELLLCEGCRVVSG